MNEYKATVTFDQPQMGFIPIMATSEEQAYEKARDMVKGHKNAEVLDMNLVTEGTVKDNVVPMKKKETE